jgi:hypothetical protein
MTFFTHPSRRDFLQAGVIAAGSLILPRSLFATTPSHFHFIHTDTLNSWPVADPVTWTLKNRGQPILERASTGLAKLTQGDGDRIIRLIVRRCDLNLIEIQPQLVTVQHWGQQQADLRPFFKTNRLARPEIAVVLLDRKKETVTKKTGDDFLFGSRIAPDFPLDLFQNKFANRFTNDPDDWQAAPNTNSGFAWDGLEDNRIPWAAMKSAWRRAAPGVCLNCDGETLLVNFGLRPLGMFNRCQKFTSVCGACRRSFKDESVKDVTEWMATNLDVDVRPGFEMVWGRRVEREAKA